MIRPRKTVSLLFTLLAAAAIFLLLLNSGLLDSSPIPTQADASVPLSNPLATGEQKASSSAILGGGAAATKNSQNKPAGKPAGKRLLVAIFTTVQKLQRRSLIRNTYMRLRPTDAVDVVFVFGKPASKEQATMMALESSLHKDIMVVNCTENMDNGKTYAFFSHAGSTIANGTYDYVMKTDDDVWLHLPNLFAWVDAMPRQGTFFGREVGDKWFMAGMGYGMSWDLVHWIAHDPLPAKHSEGQEDAVLAGWLKSSGLMKNWVTDTKETFYDEPFSKQEWAHPYTANTILIHRLKDETWFLKAAQHFLGHLTPDIPFVDEDTLVSASKPW